MEGGTVGLPVGMFVIEGMSDGWRDGSFDKDGTADG